MMNEINKDLEVCNNFLEGLKNYLKNKDYECCQYFPTKTEDIISIVWPISGKIEDFKFNYEFFSQAFGENFKKIIFFPNTRGHYPIHLGLVSNPVKFILKKDGFFIDCTRGETHERIPFDRRVWSYAIRLNFIIIKPNGESHDSTRNIR